VLHPTLELILAPGLVGVSTVASRRWGEHVGGLVSAFPAIVGPVLFIAAREHGTAFAARTASGTLLGLVALSGFVLVYGQAAMRTGWRTSLAAGWGTAAVIGALLSAIDADAVVGLAAATLSLLAAYRLLPRVAVAATVRAAPSWDLPVRMALTAALVASLAASAAAVGPAIGGLLAALPVLASILAAGTHQQNGPVALVALLRGMLSGMAGFVVFCVLVAALVDRTAMATAFSTAAVAAIAVHAALARLGGVAGSAH
jgi:hypothetical protein